MARGSKDPVLFDLFTAQGDRLANCGRQIADLVTSKQSKREAIAENIAKLESEADEILGKIIKRADDMLITPFDRSDIHELANVMDDVIDCIDGAAELSILHKVEDFPKAMSDQVDCVRRLAELTGSNLGRLKSLKDMDFYYSEAQKIEDQGDRIHRRITAKLYSGEYDALTVLRLQGVVEQLEESLDLMARVARVVRSIAAQES